jgi:hypothetical protein
MELDISKCIYDGKWFDCGNGKLKIRPYPASKLAFVVKDGGAVFSGEQNFEKFKFCLVAWEGFVTPAPENKPITLNDDVKKKIFDFRISVKDGDKEVFISDFVTEKADELFKEAQVAEKN